jgi:Anti-sigma factor NepR
MSEIPGVTKPGIPAPNVTKKPTKRECVMNLALRRLPVQPEIQVSPVDSRIRAFLAGETDGEDVLHAMYDHVLDEPVPERLRAILKR